MIKKCVLILGLVLLCSGLFAADENGVQTKVTSVGKMQIKEAVHFDNYALTSSVPVFNMAGGTQTADGSIIATAFDSKRLTQVNISFLSGGTVTVQIKGKLSGMSTWGNHFTKQYNSITSDDDIRNILEYSPDFKIGVFITGGTATVSVRSVHISKF